MNRGYCVLLLPAILAVASGLTFAHITEQHHIPGQPVSAEPREVVRIFFKAVDRGELIVFDQRLDRSMINPVRVEYAYELDSNTSRMKVYSELRQPAPVPGHPDCALRGVSAILDNYGHITDIEAHVWPTETR